MSPSNSASSALAAGEDGTNNKEESRTTILSPGIVESRNYASKPKISAEIQAFLSGTDGNGASLGFKSEFRTLFTIWMFITRLPSPAWIDLHPGYLMRGMSYFPMVGSVLGGIYAIVFDCFNVSIGLPPIVAAAVAVGFGLSVTGCFHEDGLADSADGLGGGWSKSQVLKIMTDSRVGTFGCAALSLFLFGKLQLIGSLGSSHWRIDFQGGGGGSSGAAPAILVAQTLSRLSAPYLIRTRDYVAEVGPKSPFYLFMVEAKYLVSWSRVFFATLYCFVLSSMVYDPVISLVLIVAVFAMSHLAGNKGDYLLGGVMGDFLGGTICISEIVVLILIASKEYIIETCRLAMETMNSAAGSGAGVSNPLLIMAALYSNDRIRPLFHLILLMAILKIWCSLVGPPDMYDREDCKDGEEDGQKKRE